MTVNTQAPASGESARPSAPLTRREALALERAATAGGRAAGEPAHPHHARTQHRHAHASSSKPDGTAATPNSSESAPAGARASWVRRWQPRRQHDVVVASAAGAAPKPATNWVRTLAGAGIVAGLVATIGIPAYSLSVDGTAFAASDMFTSSQQLAQSVDVASDAAGQAAGTDGYTSLSASQVAAERIQSIRSASGYIPASQSAGDDYPFWNQATEANGGGLSPLGYYYRECVDFVAWRLNRDVGSTSSPWRYTWHNLASGSAYMWYSAWQSKGWPTSSIPVSGAVAWFPYNHVAYVRSVNSDGTVTIEEYNQQSDHLYHVRSINASDAVYLYPPG